MDVLESCDPRGCVWWHQQMLRGPSESAKVYEYCPTQLYKKQLRQL